MKVKRTYGQYCGLAHALDLVGERWTLLVVRELLLGPRRFGELEAALPGIGPNLLSQRLSRLAELGVTARRDGRYELTEHGRELREAVVALARWGLRTIGPPREPLAFETRWLALTLEASFRPEAVPGLSETWEYRVDGEPFAVVVESGRATVSAGTAAAPDVVVTTSRDALLALGSGLLGAEEAAERGLVHVTGDAAAYLRSVAALAVAPPAPA